MSQFRKFSHILAIGGGLMLSAGCDEKTVQQAMRGLGFVSAAPADGASAGPVTRGERGGDGIISSGLGAGNANANANDNTDDTANDNAGNSNDNTDDHSNDNVGNSNDNADDNSNDNTGNTNDNTDDNSNDNADDNSNDNSSGGQCPDGSIRLEGEMDAPVELEAEYRLLPAGCARFRVEVRDYVAGSYEILVNGATVGSIVVDDDGRGSQAFDTEDGSFPSGFPLMAMGDIVQVGTYSVTMGDDCSLDDVDSCNTNDNSNDNSNSNGNSNDNTDDNSNDNTDDDSNDNSDDNLNDNSDDDSNDNTDDSNDNTDDNSNDNG